MRPGGFTFEVQHLLDEYLCRCSVVEALSGSGVIGAQERVEVASTDGIEIGFSRQVAAQASVCVLDASFLPGGVGVAEEGGCAERVQLVVACEFRSVVEGEGLSERGGQDAEPVEEHLGDVIRGLGFGSSCDHEAGISLVQSKYELSILGETHEIGFPVSWDRAVTGCGIAIIYAFSALNEACGTAAASTAPSTFAFGARQEEAPAVVFGAGDLGVDEAIDGLVGDAFRCVLALHATGDLLR